MSSNVTPMSRPDMDRDMGNMGGSYAGANDMANNGLSANQNQVSLNDILLQEYTTFKKVDSIIIHLLLLHTSTHYISEENIVLLLHYIYLIH